MTRSEIQKWILKIAVTIGCGERKQWTSTGTHKSKQVGSRHCGQGSSNRIVRSDEDEKLLSSFLTDIGYSKR